MTCGRLGIPADHAVQQRLLQATIHPANWTVEARSRNDSVSMSVLRLHFDGGKNKRGAYGSFELVEGENRYRRRLQFIGRHTSNEAEYLSLIAGLRFTLDHVEATGRNARNVQIAVFGDSLLVVRQVAGDWRTLNPRMAELCEESRSLYGKFGECSSIEWCSRNISVAL